ncbi:MAG TPA: phosphate ABC transporter permease subunit PstC, partial [Campylobacterales bacterium]|nr:phosphate ABC transporter permease subunit PstC [Campylobacterales bacterium]
MQKVLDKSFEYISKFSALLVLVVLVSIFWVLFQEAKLSINTFGLNFLTESKWAPNLEIFGGAPAIFGSIASTFLAMIIAIPIAIGIAIFLIEIA